jgi:hypothetical protein
VFEYLAIGLEDHVVRGAGDAVRVAARGLDRQRLSAGGDINFGVDGERERESEADRIKAGAEVG